MAKTCNRMKALLTAVALGVFCAYAQTSTPAGFILPDADPDAAPYDFRMSKTDDGMSVSLILNRINRTVTDSVVGTCRVSVPGLSSTTFAGLPALPYKAFRIAPEGSGTPQIIVRDSTYIDIPVNLDHNPRIEYDSIGQPRQIAVARVEYSGFMPSDLARVTDTQTYRDRPIYTITVMPMKYDRATGVLRVFTSLDIDIAYTVQAQLQSAAGVTRSAAFNAYTDRMLTETLGEQAVAFSTDRQVATMGIIDDTIRDTPVEFDPYDRTEDMLVISYKDPNSGFTAATDSLREWKKNLGYRVHVVERGSWTPEITDSVIKYHYNHDPNLTTVLIMGTHGITPLKYRNQCLTDLSYMCMDGLNDAFPDVAYGRILANCKQHANWYVSKIIKYEKGAYSFPEVYNKAFLATKYWWDEPNGRFLPTLEDIHTILESYGINAQRIYTTDPDGYPTVWSPHYQNRLGVSPQMEPMPSYLQKPQFAWDGTKYDIINAFNDGVNLGIYNGHGARDGWSGFKFLDADCRNFTFSNSAPLVFSIGCCTADHTTYPNCITAELFRQTSGAIAVIASTFETYLGWSDALLLGMVDAIWPNAYSFDGWTDSTTRMPVYNLYDILNNGHLRLELEQGGGYWDYGNIPSKSKTEYNRETFSVFGDPTINYTTKAPTPFNTVALLATDKYLTINVGTQELPAKAVIKNLRTGKFTTRSITSGALAPENKISITGDTLEIVVTGHNKVPYREIFCGSTPIQISKGKIKSVVYDRTTQKATVTYALNASGHVSFAVTDLNNNAIQATIEITEQENKQIIHLTNAPTGICVISMMVDGEVVDTYKLLKQ